VAPGHAGCASLLLSIAKVGFPYISTYRRFGRSGHLPVNGTRPHATPSDPPKCGILPRGPHGPCVQRGSHSLRPKRTWWVAKKCLNPHLRGLCITWTKWDVKINRRPVGSVPRVRCLTCSLACSRTAERKRSQTAQRNGVTTRFWSEPGIGVLCARALLNPAGL
jgi:hypothetical protein